MLILSLSWQRLPIWQEHLWSYLRSLLFCILYKMLQGKSLLSLQPRIASDTHFCSKSSKWSIIEYSEDSRLHKRLKHLQTKCSPVGIRPCTCMSCGGIDSYSQNDHSRIKWLELLHYIKWMDNLFRYIYICFSYLLFFYYLCIVVGEKKDK